VGPTSGETPSTLCGPYKMDELEPSYWRTMEIPHTPASRWTTYSKCLRVAITRPSVPPSTLTGTTFNGFLLHLTFS
jgi:hypothetical protein